MEKMISLSQVPCGEVFRIGKFEFIKFSEKNGVTEAGTQGESV